ncbi:MAG: DUF2339 domain-containing protein, partial [Calditrichaceae bacterium]
GSFNNKKIQKKLQDLEKRIGRIESFLEIEADSAKSTNNFKEQKRESNDAIEFQIGEFWLSKVGIVVLSIGFAFLLSLSYKEYPAVLPGIIGYIITIILYISSNFFRKTNENISRYLLGSAIFILFFSTLRMHFFSENPAIQNLLVEFILLIVIVSINLFVSLKNKAVYMTAITLIMAYITALTSPNSYALFFVLTIISALTVYFKIKYQWHHILTFGIILTYFSHFIWFINNPVLGNDIHLLAKPWSNMIFIMAYIIIFSLGNYFRKDKLVEDNYLISATFFNCFLGFSLLTLIVFTRFRELGTIINYIASSLFLGLAIFSWIRQKSKYATFFYAMFGYAALSIAIISQFEQQNTFVWLCWQSLIVISTAIWFRSKYIIVTNFFIYVLILVGYFGRIESFDLLSLSFGLTAIISARLLNWQKDKLELRTEYMRNAYLLSAFLIFPVTLYKLVPQGYVIIAWIGIALGYYILSKILTNKKYRLMALGTLFLSVLYIFIVGIIQLEGVYRVISFIVLGIVLIFTSLIYTQIRKRITTNQKMVRSRE